MMKTIVNKKVCKEIFIDNLQGDEIVAYKCKSPDSIGKYAILSRLVKPGGVSNSFGFVPVGDSKSNPRYTANHWHEAVQLASASRELKVFDTDKELIEAMYKNMF